MRMACVLAFIAACGGSGGGDDDGGGLAAESFPADFLRIECEAAARCGDYETVATCEASSPIDRFYAQAVLGVAAGVVRFDAEAAAACLAYRRNAECRSQFRAHDDPCLRAYVGLVADGEACQFDEACTSSRCAVTDPSCDGEGCCAGTCMPWTVLRDVPIGGTCSSDDDCVDGAYCDASDTCAPLIAAEGAPCEEQLDCAEPMVCNIFAARPTCVRPAEPGAACDESAAQPCIDARDSCRGGTCQRQLEPGESCVGFSDCVRYASCDAGMCVAEPAAGDACGPDLPACAGLTACRDGVCVPPDPWPVCER